MFGENKLVMQFVFANFGGLYCGFVDDSVLLTKEELGAYENNQEIPLEERMRLLLEVK